MIKQYESPQLEVIFLEINNIVVTSLTNGGIDDGTSSGNSGSFEGMFGDQP